MSRRAAVLLGGLLVACAGRPEATLLTAPEAAHWSPFVAAPTPLGTPPGPPATAELEAVRAWQAKRTPRDVEAIAYWQAEHSTMRWDAIARDLTANELTATVAAARAFAAMHTAMADALVACWRAKAESRRPPPFICLLVQRLF